jgi:cellobiose-specific phosphotransferase system component IIC
MRKRKFSISKLLVSALGLIMCLKAFIYVLEHYVLQVTGTPGLKVDDSFLNITFGVLSFLLVFRISYVLWSAKRKKQHAVKEVAIEASLYECATCGKTVSEKVRQYCLSKPQKFQQQIFCYEHQR